MKKIIPFLLIIVLLLFAFFISLELYARKVEAGEVAPPSDNSDITNPPPEEPEEIPEEEPEEPEEEPEESEEETDFRK